MSVSCFIVMRVLTTSSIDYYFPNIPTYKHFGLMFYRDESFVNFTFRLLFSKHTTYKDFGLMFYCNESFINFAFRLLFSKHTYIQTFWSHVYCGESFANCDYRMNNLLNREQFHYCPVVKISKFTTPGY